MQDREGNPGPDGAGSGAPDGAGSPPAPDLAASLARVITVACGRDPELAQAVRALCSAVLGALDRKEEPAAAEPATAVEAPASRTAPRLVAPTTPTPTPAPSPVTVPLPALASAMRPLARESATPQVAVFSPGRTRESVSDDDLPAIGARLRLKAEACRRVAERERLAPADEFARDAAVSPDADLIDQARERDAFLWMLVARDRPSPEDPSAWEALAACYEAAASAAHLVVEALRAERPSRDDLAEALQLLASAQSSVRSGMRDLTPGADRPLRPDRDQLQLHHWLEGVTARESIYVRRHMRSDDPAEPSDAPALSERIAAIRARIADRGMASKRRRQALNRLRYHADAIVQAAGADREHDWRKIVEAADELISAGAPPSDVEIRDVLLPIVDEMPDLGGELPRSFQLVLREIDRFAASRASAAPESADTGRGWSPEVARVADLLRGRKAVIIGGECRTAQRAGLEKAFELDELVWISTREHQSIEGFIPTVARPDVAVVMLAIRWASHSFGDIKQACEASGKPFVRLPAGYSPNQVAAQVLAQASRQLAPQQAGGGAS